ncbi:MAG: hypothetical protein V7767_10110 [Leeuwenhoekiella sp.]
MEDVTPGNYRPMDFKEWALNIFLSSIPIVGFIILLVWAFGDDANTTRKEWAKGRLLIAFLGFLLVMGFLFLFGGITILSSIFN